MKAKRIFKLSLWVIFGLLVIMTFVFLYKKAQPQATIYSVETVTRVPSIQRSIILTGKIAPRNEVMIVPQLNGIIAEIMKKPGDLVKAGDIIEVTFGNRPIKVKVLSDVEPRTKDVAREMYEIISE